MMKMMKRFLSEIFKRMGAVMGTLWVVMSLTSCELIFSGDDEEMEIYKSKAWLNKSVVNYNETTLSGGILGDPESDFKITISNGKEWASFSATTQVNEIAGKIGAYGTTFFIYFSSNQSESERSGKLLVKFSDGKSFELPFSQWGKGDNSDYNRAWGEQPAYNGQANYIHKTYFTTLAGQTKPVRNYSICYDTKTLVSRWVAYPITNAYKSGSVGRTEEWSFDDAYYVSIGNGYRRQYISTPPIIPQSQQQNIAEGGYGYGSGMDRGHMLPSASRQCSYEFNAQTYYATNMMPQHSGFNQGVWASLEGYVRNASCADTLFVVTGTLFEKGSQSFTSRGRTITRPSHAYKLLLRTKTGNIKKAISEISSANELICIAFLFENNANGDNTTIEDAVVSVSEIEERSGFSFYQNLNPEIATAVKNKCSYDEWKSAFRIK